MRIDVIGVDLAIARMVALSVASAKAVDAGVEVGAAEVLAVAASRVPVLTGALRDSLEITHDDDGGALIGTELEYAPFVEFGTSDTPAQPFLRPAADSAADEVTQAVDVALQTAIRGVAGL